MIFPTIRNLEDVAQFDTVDELMAGVRARDEVPPILPKIVRGEDGGMSILMPGQPGYDDA